MTRSVGLRASRSAMPVLGLTLVLGCGGEPTAPRPVATAVSRNVPVKVLGQS